MTRRAALVALVTALATSGCSIGHHLNSSTGDELAQVSDGSVDTTLRNPWGTSTVGECFGGLRFGDVNAAAVAESMGYPAPAAAQLADDPLWSDAVDCAEPHQIEIYGVVGLPADVDASVSSYADLLDVTTPLYRAVRSSVTEQCARKLPGIADVVADTKLDVDVLPMIASDDAGRRAWDPVPIDTWEAGERHFVCTYQQESASSTAYASILTDDFPVDGRSCLAGETFVPCTQAHDAERIALFIVDRAVDRGQLHGAEAVDRKGLVDLSALQWTWLDDACQRYLNAVTADPPKGLFGVTDTYPELYPNEFGSFNILCLARSPFGTKTGDLVSSTSSVYNR